MRYKVFDYQCPTCKAVEESLLVFEGEIIECSHCPDKVQMQRMMPAPYGRVSTFNVYKHKKYGGTD